MLDYVAPEKRQVTLDIYHKTKSVYTEKEILSLATKADINANTVADINQGQVTNNRKTVPKRTILNVIPTTY
eukprot:10949263-Ditylum_brightwellii.AAC.1